MGSVVESVCLKETQVLSLRSGGSPGEGNSNPLQDSCLGNPMHTGAWQATVRGLTQELDLPEQLKQQWGKELKGSELG